MKNFFTKHRYSVISAVSLVLLLVIWKVSSLLINMPLILPSPEKTAAEFKTLICSGEFYFVFFKSFLRCVLAFSISAAGGFIFGICSYKKSVSAFISPWIIIIQSTPVVAVILLSIFIFDSSSVPVVVAVLMTLPVITRGIEGALKKNNEGLIRVLSFYEFTRCEKLKYAFFPELMPVIKSVLISALSMTWKVVAAGEVLSLPRHALGSSLYQAQVHLETARLFAVTAIIILGSYLSLCLLKLVLAVFRVRHIFVSSDAQIENLPEVNFLDRKKTTAILGKNGCGKTTYLNYYAKTFKAKVSFVTQENFLLNSFTVFENIFLPLKKVFSEKEAYSRALFFVKYLRLFEERNSPAAELSGGEKQRVCLARAFAFPGQMILFDEAFSSQDLDTKLFLEKFTLELLEKEKRSLIFVTHDTQEVFSMAEEIYFLKSGSPDFVMEKTDREKLLKMTETLKTAD